MKKFYWQCPQCGWRWTIFEDQFKHFPVDCLDCRKFKPKHKVTEKEVREFPSEEAIEYDD